MRSAAVGTSYALPFLALFSLAIPARAAAATKSEIDEAETQLARDEAELSAPSACVSMCKALQSMINAAERICALADKASSEEQKRCQDARTRVADAIARVRAACPDCNVGPPLAPSAGTPKPRPQQPEFAGQATALPASAPSEAIGYRRPEATSPRLSVTIDPLRLFLPTLLVQLRFEKAITSSFSVALAGAYGSLPTKGGNGRLREGARASASMLGVELRGYLVGRVDRFGLFVAGEITHRNATMLPEEHLDARSFVLGLSAGPLVGMKMVTRGGFTFESRVGASYVLDDQRRSGASHERIVPNFGVGVGFTL